MTKKSKKKEIKIPKTYTYPTKDLTIIKPAEIEIPISESKIVKKSETKIPVKFKIKKVKKIGEYIRRK